MSTSKTVSKTRKLADGTTRTYTYTYNTIKGSSIRERNRQYKKKSYALNKKPQPPKHRKLADDVRLKILHYFELGLSVPKIAKATKTSQYAVMLVTHDEPEKQRLLALSSSV